MSVPVSNPEYDYWKERCARAEERIASHNLANGGCVPMEALDVACDEIQRTRAVLKSLAEEWEASDSSDNRSGLLRVLLSGGDVAICDGCERTGAVITADGGARLCVPCLIVANCEHLWVAENFEPYCGKCGTQWAD